MRPRKRFGQHFLIDGNLMRSLVAAAEVGPDDLAIEVGGGTGGLTDLLVIKSFGIGGEFIASLQIQVSPRRFVSRPVEGSLLFGFAAAPLDLNGDGEVDLPDGGSVIFGGQ